MSAAAGIPRPEPRYAVRLEPSCWVPMRDGVRLATDLYFPAGRDGPLPTILIRTPYNKHPHRRDNSEARLFAGQGFAVAVQDMRGKFESEGQYKVSAADRVDGDDTVTWLAEQPWSNGKVGTYGCSYLGENQLQLAACRNPRHAAMLPKAAGGATRYFGCWTGGAFELLTGVEWFRVAGATVHPQFPPGTSREDLLRAAPFFDLAQAAPEIDRDAALRGLPTVDLHQQIGAPPSDFEGFISHAPGDDWWAQFNYVTPDDQFDVPALLLDSWHDYGVADTLRFYAQLGTHSLSERGRDNRHLIIGPDTHCRWEQATAHTMVSKRDVGDARLDFFAIYLRWFRHWLEDESVPLDLPRVRYFLIGKGAWRTADDWPIPGTQFTPYYLHSGGRANSRFGDGALSVEPPAAEPPDHFTYDPATPVPRVGGPVGVGRLPAGVEDQSVVETRHDVLVYSTPPLDQGVEITGPLEATLYVSSSARDTDFTAKLVEVLPDGTAWNVQEGILRARYRNGYAQPELMQPDEVYELRVSLGATGTWFAPGHRIRLEVSSSNFPRFDRNLNTGGNNWNETEWVVAHNTIHHDATHPSHIMLPIVPE